MKNNLFKPVFLVLVILGFPGITLVHAGAGKTGLPFSILHEGVYSNAAASPGRGFKSIDNAHSYQKTLAQYSSASPVAVDFSANRVVLLDLGEKNSGGYAINVTRVEQTADEVIIRLLLSMPGKDCFTIQALTHPYLFLEIPATKKVSIRQKRKEISCGAPGKPR